MAVGITEAGDTTGAGDMVVDEGMVLRAITVVIDRIVG